MQTAEEVQRLIEALQNPFEPDEVKFKPAVVSGNRALALAYVDARVIQDRLDDVLGVAGWQDEYETLPDCSVVCRLRLRIGGEWITKMDVGSPSEQPDEGDRRKAAFSDALKRAAVKFGIGRYLYRLPQLWADYDPQKRQFKSKPTLPASAMPKRIQKDRPEEKKQPAPAESTLPTGVAFRDRLNAHDKKLADAGVCNPGELVKYVVQEAFQAGWEGDFTMWPEAAVRFAAAKVKAFEAARKKPVGQN